MSRIFRPMLIFAVLAVAGVLSASCSSTQDAQRDTSKGSTSDVIEYDIEEVADKAIDLLGSPPKASVAVLVAADDGYSTEQIVEAILDGTLKESGEITGQEPDGEPQDAIAGSHSLLLALGNSSPSYLMRMVAEDDSDSSPRRGVSDIGDHYEKSLVDGRTKIWTIWTLSAISMGYSTQQITERIFLNPEQKPDFLATGGEAAVILDEKKKIVSPEHPPAWVFGGRKTVEKVTKDGEVSDKAKIRGAEATAWIVEAAATGYSDEQITEAIILGTAKTCPTQSVPERSGEAIPTVPCIVEGKDIVRPVNADEWVFDEEGGDNDGDTAAGDSDTKLAKKYTGKGTVTLSKPRTHTNTCSGNAEATLETNVGGKADKVRLEIKYDQLSSGSVSNEDGTAERPSTYSFICKTGGPERSSSVEGTASGGKVTLNQSFGSLADINGTFDEDGGQLSGTIRAGANEFRYEFPEMSP